VSVADMWYTASLLFKGVHEIVPAVPSIWEEVIVLVEAGSESDARASAERFGKSKEHEYSVSKPERHVLKWVFMQVERVYSMDADELRSGIELFCRFLRQSEVDSLLTPFEDEPQQR
jgi:Domain of unknown function (DUF4288)